MAVDPDTVRTLEDLRQMVSLAVTDMEITSGGPLPQAAQHALRHWLARAFELGSAFGAQRVKAILDPEEG